MDKAEALALGISKELLYVIQEDPVLRHDPEVCARFNELAKQEFEGRIEDYSPDVHYDYNRRRAKEKAL